MKELYICIISFSVTTSALGILHVLGTIGHHRLQHLALNQNCYLKLQAQYHIYLSFCYFRVKLNRSFNTGA